MNRGELNEAIKMEMEVDPAIVNDTERYRYINRAVDDLASVAMFEKMVTLDAEENPVPLPDDFIAEVAVYRVSADSLVQLSPAHRYNSASGTPVEYFIMSNQMFLIPFSPCEIRLIYTYRPTGVSEIPGEEYDNSSPTLPEDWHPLIIPYAVALCHLKSGSVARYQQYLNEYTQRKMVKVAEYLKTYNARVRVPRPFPLDIPEV